MEVTTRSNIQTTTTTVWTAVSFSSSIAASLPNDTSSLHIVVSHCVIRHRSGEKNPSQIAIINYFSFSAVNPGVRLCPQRSAVAIAKTQSTPPPTGRRRAPARLHGLSSPGAASVRPSICFTLPPPQTHLGSSAATSYLAWLAPHLCSRRAAARSGRCFHHQHQLGEKLHQSLRPNIVFLPLRLDPK